MNLKTTAKILSCILMISTLLSVLGCAAKTNQHTESLNTGLLSSHLTEVASLSDNVEEDIQNNSGKIVFSSPQKEKFTLHDSVVGFSGLCNRKYPLTMNGKVQTVGEDGYFTIQYKLELGHNEVTFANGEFKKVFKITYAQPLIKSYTPSDSSLTLDGGSPLSVTAVAKTGATVKAKYNGKTITLQPKEEGDLYTTFKGIITTAKSGSNYIKITAKKGEDTETVTASKIVINSGGGIGYNPSPVKSLQNKGYVDVGTDYVAEIISAYAEGFLGGTVDDYSRPTVNYLPKGTVDYCSTSKIYDSESGKKYYLLRNNVRVYSKKSNVKVYKGSLPENNSVSFTGSEIKDKHFLMNFSVDWKAPFRFVLGGQGYNSERTQDYGISSPTFSYVDITFCYSNSLKNFSLSENPIFKSYKIIKNSKDYTLRLYLKSKGNFWGWKASYNSSGELVFSFLCPSTVKKANNKYGYSLEGIKITIDAGHGGTDSGTYNAANSPYYEKYYALVYAKALANELLKLGATVYMQRTEDKSISLENRYNYITATNADLAVSIHFNGSDYGSTNGYFMGYFNPYTYKAAKSISKSIASTGLISAQNGGTDWHYFNLSRVSACPVVLTENGYLTGISDYKKIKTSAFCKGYIEGMVRGIVNYFAENSGYAVDYSSSDSNKITVSTASKITPSRVIASSSKSQSTASLQRPITVVSSTPSRVVASSKPQESSSRSSSSPAASKPIVSSKASSSSSVSVSSTETSSDTNTSATPSDTTEGNPSESSAIP